MVIGRITSAHGIRGEVRVRVLGDGPEYLLSLDSVLLSSAGESPETDASARKNKVRGSRAGRPGEVRLALEGVEDRDVAAALRGTWVLTDATDLPELGEDEHYWYEVVGYVVEDLAGEVVGIVQELLETPAHDILVIANDVGEQHLVPIVDAFVKEILRDERRIRIDAIPGLLGD